MIDVIGLALGAAQQILASVISDAIGGGRAARKRQIEREALEKAAAQPGLSKADIDVLAARIVSEVRYLVHEHPDLEWRMTGIQVRPPVPQPDRNESATANALLHERLERLNRIARTRWEQVRSEFPEVRPGHPTPPPVKSEPIQTEGVDGITDPVRTEPVAIESAADVGARIVAVRDYEMEQPSYWQQRLEGMRANVQADRRRRAANDSDARAGGVQPSDTTAPVPKPPSAA